MKEETYRRPAAGQHPPNLSPDYKSTTGRSPRQPAIVLPQTLSEITGPLLQTERLDALESDLTRQRMGEPLGERIIVQGRVLDEDGKPVPDALVEIWQCNAAGRYHHPGDQHDAPLDPNFNGGGRARADAEGNYRFVTIKPGAYPWKNHHNAWRPAHIHFSLFGPGLRHAPDHPDVLPQRSAAGLRSDLQLGARRARASACRPPSTWTPPSPNGRSATASTSCCAAATPRRWNRRMLDKGTTKQPLTLRRARSARLEGWATPRLVPTLRDAGLRPAPQGEVGAWINT